MFDHLPRLKPLDIGTSRGNPFLAVPAGCRTFLHLFAGGRGIQHKLGSALRALFVKRLGGAVDPLYVITPGSLTGGRIPYVGGALFHLFAETGNDKDQRTCALRTFLIKRHGLYR